MKYLICAIAAISMLSACGGGTRYSSQRAQAPQPTYIPVTPGAVPVTSSAAAVTPVTPVEAIPAASPAYVATGATSLRPPARGTAVVAPVQVATATPAPVRVVARAPAPQRVALFATGPIYTACKAAGRKAATKARCGCIQAVADKELSKSQQRRGAGYFDNQHKLQQVRQSDSSTNEAFWTAWKAYGKSAARQCS
jgi:hypothetical protein